MVIVGMQQIFSTIVLTTGIRLNAGYLVPVLDRLDQGDSIATDQVLTEAIVLFSCVILNIFILILNLPNPANTRYRI